MPVLWCLTEQPADETAHAKYSPRRGSNMNPITLADVNFKVQDEFLEEPEMRELEKIAEEVMTPRKVVRRTRREGSKEETEEKIAETEEAIIGGTSNYGDVSNCPHCNKTLPVGSLQHHLRTAHSQVNYIERQSV